MASIQPGQPGLKLHPFPGLASTSQSGLEKDVWENVPAIVFKSFHIVSTNMTNIKKWTDKADEKLQELRINDQHVEEHVDALDASLKDTQEHLEVVSAEVTEIREQSDREFHTFTSCIKQLLDASLILHERFAEAFDPGNDLKYEQLNLRHLDEAGHQGKLEDLMALCNHLDGHSKRIGIVFDNWAKFRTNVEEKNCFMKDKIVELHKASELARERLLSWRELLKNGQLEIGSLNVALKRTQDDVRGIQDLQVTSKDVHGIVDQRVQQLQELHSHTEEHVNTIQTNLEAHVGRVNHAIGEMDQSFQGQMDKHSSNVRQMLEGSLNPITAYLNSMHVKADAARVDLDKVSAQVPTLQTAIEKVSSQMQRCDNEGRERNTILGNRLEDLVRESMESFQRNDTERTELSDSLHTTCNELGTRVTELRKLLEQTSQALESVKVGELSNVAHNLLSLEQKVAKWVHSSQLPAKVSEARLYALEAKMAGETECRLQLEEAVKDRGPSRGPLPALPPSRPNTQGRPRSKGSMFGASPSDHLSGLTGITPERVGIV